MSLRRLCHTNADFIPFYAHGSKFFGKLKPKYQFMQIPTLPLTTQKLTSECIIAKIPNCPLAVTYLKKNDENQPLAWEVLVCLFFSNSSW